ncbi:hypothetical protein BSKO_04773 [Bryopsis sp. KO-2023]|nr:hypothetical protein BSKO_04773 [Bryopsis sp. KO-2023]
MLTQPNLLNVQTIRAVRVIPHERWTGNTDDGYDIALIELENESTGKPLSSMVAAGHSMGPGQFMAAIGWGRTSASGSLSATLQLARGLELVSAINCQRQWTQLKNDMRPRQSFKYQTLTTDCFSNFAILQTGTATPAGVPPTTSPVEPPPSKGPVADAFLTAATEGDLATEQTKIANGVNIETKGETEKTALLNAAFKGHAEVVSLLLESGADISAADNLGFTAVILAAYQGFGEVVKVVFWFLLEL